ncbi:hypothetical protein L7F22_037727 [Adiantum nelumboides]|nr:hypothetical protein [Adiantum nelumboides]
MRASEERHNLQNKIKRWEEQKSGRGRGSKTTAASTKSSLKIEGTFVPLSSVPTGGCLVQLAEEDSKALAEMKNIAEGRLQDYKSRLEGAKKQVEDQVRELHRAEGAQSSNTLAINLQTEIDCMQDPVARQRLVDLIGQFSSTTRESLAKLESKVARAKNPRGGATASKGVTGKKKVCFDTVDHCISMSTAEFVPPNVPKAVDVLVVHDDVHIDADRAKLEKVTLPTPTTVESSTDSIVDAMMLLADGNVNDGGIESIVHAFIDTILDGVEAMGTDATVVSSTDAIVDNMVVDACTYAIADATVVDAYTNDIVDAMEVDASIDVAANGNVNNGGTKSIVHAIIDAILDAIEAMGIDARVEDNRGMGEVLIEREAGTREAVGASDVTVQAKVVCPSDATVEDTIGRGEEVLIEREARTREAVGASDVTVQAKVVCPSDAADDIVDVEEAKGTDAVVEDMRGLAEVGYKAIQLGMAMGEAVMAAMDMKETNTHNTTETCIEQNNEVGKGTEVPTDKAAQSREAMGEDTNEASTKNANKEAKKGHESKGQERLKCLVVTPVQIVALPSASCEEKKRRDNLCIH